MIYSACFTCDWCIFLKTVRLHVLIQTNNKHQEKEGTLWRRFSENVYGMFASLLFEEYIDHTRESKKEKMAKKEESKKSLNYLKKPENMLETADEIVEQQQQKKAPTTSSAGKKRDKYDVLYGNVRVLLAFVLVGVCFCAQGVLIWFLWTSTGPIDKRKEDDTQKGLLADGGLTKAEDSQQKQPPPLLCLASPILKVCTDNQHDICFPALHFMKHIHTCCH
jgi:hypothetical protein